MSEVKRLFEPLPLGALELRNRIVMAPMRTNLAGEQGAVTPRLMDFLVARARGGVSLIITEGACIDWPAGKDGPCPLAIHDLKYVRGLHDLVEAVHRCGVLIAIQLTHPGSQTCSAWTEDAPLVSPSGVPCQATGGEPPRALTTEEIEGLAQKFVQAAVRARIAGFDAIELQGGGGHLLAQFLSPSTNNRTDLYGADPEGRLRFPLRVLEGVRAALGPDFPVIFRLNGDEHGEGCLTVLEMAQIARRLEAAGVTAFDIVAGTYDAPPSPFSRVYPGSESAEGCNLPLADRIRREVKVPVLVGGRLVSAELAERALVEKMADAIVLGRPLLADPEWPTKAKEGRLSEIRPCIWCNEGCVGDVARAWSIGCTVNPAAGQEGEPPMLLAAKARSIVVVGGGPAGMAAACILAQRGHNVTLLEREKELGGAMLLAGQLPLNKPWAAYREYLVRRLQELRVNVRLETPATSQTVKKLHPQELVLAVGAQYYTPEKGSEKGPRLLTAPEALGPRANLGQRAVVVGGNQLACQLAWYLRAQDIQVAIVATQPSLAQDANMVTQSYLQHRLRALGIEVVTAAQWVRSSRRGVLVLTAQGEERELEADAVVFTEHVRPQVQALYELRDCGAPVHAVGDCHRLGTLGNAIWSATAIARDL